MALTEDSKFPLHEKIWTPAVADEGMQQRGSATSAGAKDSQGARPGAYHAGQIGSGSHRGPNPSADWVPGTFKVDVEGLDVELLKSFTEWVNKSKSERCYADRIIGEFNELSVGRVN